MPAIVVTLVAGCGLVPLDPTPDPEAGPGLIGDCMPPFVLQDETTLGALGLAQLEGTGAELDRIGIVRITEATTPWEDFAPPGVPAVVPEGQLLCITYPDGSGSTTLLEEPFRRPVTTREGIGGTTDSRALIGLGFVVVVVAVVSWLAFRSEGSPSWRP